jgi:hypothetical protein
MTMLRRVVAYAALALSVTVGGVIIGATVIAPIVSGGERPSAPSSVSVRVPAAMATSAATEAMRPAAEPTTPAAPSAQTVLMDRVGHAWQSMYAATAAAVSNAARSTQSYIASRRMPQLAPRVWLSMGTGAALLAAMLVALRLRSRRSGIKSAVAPGFLIPSSRPASIVVAASNRLSGRSERTPRAVMALAESGAAPQEIARRTGMPLDAVALCLSMSTMGVRQLQPPTA